jgi:D-3-phosphoglycerate dehydrogenase
MAFVLKRVLISDEIDERCVDVLKKNGVDVTKNTKLSKEQLIAEIPNYDGLIVRSATKVTADVIAAGTRLRIIGRAGTGTDNIDTEAATKHGVIVMNTPGGNTMSAAELTCALIMTTARHIAAGCESLKAGRWDRKKYMGNEVYGKTLAIIGLGRIGKEVATRMQSFGMTTIGYDPITPAEVAQSWGVEWLPMEKIWPQADYITVHTPLIPQTKNLINDDVLTKCKKGVRFINCARGGIIDEDALLRALNDGRCGGAGLDVFLEEPPKNRGLVEHPLVTCTPHLGASTEEAQSRVAVEIAEQFIDVVNGKSLFGALNAQAMSNALSPDTKPLVKLASSLGRIAAAVAKCVDSNTTVSLVTQGDSLVKAGSYLNASVLMGLLAGGSASLNLVSAPAAAKTAGVQVSCSHSATAPSQYPELVSIAVSQSGREVISLSGTVAAGKPILTTINGAALGQGVVLEGNLVLYRAEGNGQVLTSITGALLENNSQVEAYVNSAMSSDNGRWAVMKVSPPLASISSIAPLVSVAVQVEF